MERFTALIHHITTLSDPGELGFTRMVKILWLSDIEYYRQHGETLTGIDEYIKDDHGPRHTAFYDAVDILKKSESVVERSSLTPVGPRRELVPLTLPDMEGFSAEQIAIIGRMTAFVTKHSAKAISNLTHDDLWELAYINERIPVSAAVPVDGDLTPEIMNWAETIFDADRATG